MAKTPTKQDYPQVRLMSIKNGGRGDFDARITYGKDKTVQESPISRREAETRHGATTGDARAYWGLILGAFPRRDASYQELCAFADEVEIELPDHATDASRAWEAIFGETNVMEAESDGGEVAISPKLPEDEEDVAVAKPEESPEE